MKEADITQVVKESERLLRENLERNKKHSKDEIDLLVSYVGNILWFTTAHQSLTLVKNSDFYKSSELYKSMKKFLEE